MKYRKKPVVIEAIKWTGTLDLWMERDKNKLLIDAYESGEVIIPTDGTLHIRTLEGVMIASKGDYIIKGVKGEIYPCKPDIFEMTYEEV